MVDSGLQSFGEVFRALVIPIHIPAACPRTSLTLTTTSTTTTTLMSQPACRKEIFEGSSFGGKNCLDIGTVK